MADELMEFPSELIQKEFAKDPSKLLNSMNHIKEIPSKNKNSIEQKEKLTDKNNNLSNIILNNTKENLHSKKDLDSIEKNKNDININVNFFNIKDIGANINNVEYINNVNNIKNNFFVNNNYNYDGNNINGIKNSLININEIIGSNDSYSKLNISENNHFPHANVNNNPFSKNGNLFGYIFSPNIKNNNININGNKNILFNNANLILMNLKTYKGSIFVQEFLDELNNNELNTLFVNLMPHISFIMCLEYGNYFFQKLIKKLNLQQRLEIYKIIEPNFLEIATNKSGTHSIQSLIECINSPIELIVFDKLLNKNRLILFLNENAYHIIMKIILEIDEDKRNNLNLFLY